MSMRLALKKSQKTLDTSKRLHRNTTRIPGSVGKGLINLLPSLALWTRQNPGASSLRAPSGAWNALAGGAYNRVLVLNSGSPRPKDEVFKVCLT